jgi:CheY-like chemotaxis protein
MPSPSLRPPLPDGPPDHPPEFDLHAWLAALHQQHLAAAVARGLMLQVVIDSDVPRRIGGDGKPLPPLVAALLANALAVTSHGLVRLHASLVRPRWLRLVVEDTGPGIPRSAHLGLFHAPPRPADQPLRGLLRCRQLAQAAGGAIGVRSRAGAGAQFWLELPFTTAQRPPLADAQRQRLAGVLRGAPVVLLSDHPVDRLIAASALQHWGLQVHSTADAAAALQQLSALAATAPANAVVVDLDGADGSAAAALLRQQHARERLPIIAIGGAAAPPAAQRAAALACGMNDHLAKPLDLARLGSVLAHWVAAAREARVAGH